MRMPSVEELVQFIDLLSDAAILTDRDGRIVHGNAPAEALFGYGQGQLEGQLIEALVPESRRAAHTTQRSGYIAHPARRPMGTNLNIEGRRKDGLTIPLDIALSPVEVNGATFVLSVIRDLTERKQIEKVLQREKERLKQSNELMMNREERILELKREVNALCHELGRPPTYTMGTGGEGKPGRVG